MRKHIAVTVSSLLLMMLGVLYVPSVAQAATQPYNGACGVQGASSSQVCSAGGGNPLVGANGTLSKVTSALAIVGGIVAVIFIIVGGIKYIFSGGDSAATASAKNTIIYAVVGLVVVILAKQIISFVLNRL